MAPIPLTPPSSGHDTDYSPLAPRASKVNKSRPSRRFKSSSKPAVPKFTWAKRHRLTLRVCYELSLEVDNRLRAFNTIHKEDCSAAGFEDGIRKGALNAQWQERRKTTCQAWREVMAATEAELESAKRDVVDCLEINDSSQAETPSRVNQYSSSSRRRTPSRNLSARSGKSRSNRRNPQPFQTPTAASQAKPTTLHDLQAASQQKRRCASRGFPEDTVISKDRTRNLKGKVVPVISPDDPPYEDIDPVPEVEAHTPVPELLFRYYHSGTPLIPATEHCLELPGLPGTAGYNGGRKGFLAAKFMSLPHGAPHPHHCSSPHLRASALSHLTGTRLTSELISVSSSFYFEMRMAAKKAAAGKSDVRISIIRGSGLRREQVYRSWPYYLRFKEQKAFLGGTWRNPASHEYWIWANIPSTAILQDVSLEDIEKRLTQIPSLYKALRFNDLWRDDMNNNNMQTKHFMKNPVPLTYVLVIGLAEFLPHIGITTNSPDAYIARFVAEFIRGWKIQLVRQEEGNWDKLAGIFASVLNHHCNAGPPDALRYARNAQAFLSGLQTGMGEINWNLDPDKQRRMVRKIAQLGMTCSILLVDQVEVPMGHADASDEVQTVTALCADGGDEEDDGDDSEINTTSDAVADETAGTSNETIASSIENIDNDPEHHEHAKGLEDLASTTTTPLRQHTKNPQDSLATPLSQEFQDRRAGWDSKDLNMDEEDSEDGQEFHTPRPTNSPLWSDKNTFLVNDLGKEREIFEISDYEEEEEEEENQGGDSECDL